MVRAFWSDTAENQTFLYSLYSSYRCDVLQALLCCYKNKSAINKHEPAARHFCSSLFFYWIFSCLLSKVPRSLLAFFPVFYVHSVLDYLCAVKRIIPHTASVHTKERWFWRDFCNGAKLHHLDLESGAAVQRAFLLGRIETRLFRNVPRDRQQNEAVAFVS